MMERIRQHRIRPDADSVHILRAAFIVLGVLGVALATGCGKDKPTAPPVVPTGSVLVSPSDPTILLGDTLRFKATLSGISGGVVWRLAPGNGSTVDLGTITPDGLYTAPASGAASVDFKVLVTAKAQADTTVFGTVLATIPRIQVVVQPSLLTSVPPGTDVPYSVQVRNALDAGFDLFVEGILGGDATVGLFEATGPNGAVYRALDQLGQLTAYSLLVRSTQDPTGASATPFVSVRRGFQLLGDPARQQMSPAWGPGGTLIAYAEGPPWNLVVHTPSSGARVVATSIDDPAPQYDGRLSWSPDGEWICFSELQGGRRVLGVVGPNGANRGTFDPDGVSEVLDGAFLPTDPTDPESLLVVLRSGTTYRLRAYPLALSPGEPGVAVLEPPAGVALRHPDAVRFDGVLHICVSQTSAGNNEILAFAVDGQPLDIVPIDPGSSGPALRPLWTRQVTLRRITYISGATGTAYRATWKGGAPPIRLYAEFYPEQAIDRVEARPNDVVMARLHPDGFHRVWVVEFPPPEYLPKPTEEEDLRALGAWSAWTPSVWARWQATGLSRIRQR